VYRRSSEDHEPLLETAQSSYDELENDSYVVYDTDNNEVNHNEYDFKKDKKNSFKNNKNNNTSIEECGGLNMMKITDQVSFINIFIHMFICVDIYI
jgi:hypothetical protein